MLGEVRAVLESMRLRTEIKCTTVHVMSFQLWTRYDDMAVNCLPWAYHYTVKGIYVEAATFTGLPGKAAKTYYQIC